MLSNKKTIVVVALFGVALAPLCWVGRAQGTANEKLPSAVELLDKYTENQDKLQSIIARSETSTSAVRLSDDDKEEYASRRFSEFRSDGSRIRRQSWTLLGSPNTDPSASDSVVSDKSARESHHLYDGKYTFHFQRPGSVQIEVEKDGGHGWPRQSYRGRELMGYFYSDDERVDSILRRSEKVSVRDKLERVGRSKCYVIDAVTERGRYTLWIDPEHGYNIAKAEKEAGDRRLPKGKTKYSSLRNVQFEKIDGVWVPMEGDMEFGHQGPGWDYSEKKHHKRKEVILNPDHEALRSFYPDDIPSGTEVKIGFAGSPPGRDGQDDIDDAGDFRWKPGAQFVVNESCRVVRKDYNKHLLPIVKALDVGALVRRFKVVPAPATTKGKHIVLCFWNINQKQSQQLLLALRNRQEALAKKGVSVIAVEASGAKTDKVRIWAKENELPYSLGAFYTLYERCMEDCDDDDDKPVLSDIVSDILVAYRVDRLPWLILTDKERIVTAEGFRLEEVDERIKDAEEAEVITNKIAHLTSEGE